MKGEVFSIRNHSRMECEIKRVIQGLSQSHLGASELGVPFMNLFTVQIISVSVYVTAVPLLFWAHIGSNAQNTYS